MTTLPLCAHKKIVRECLDCIDERRTEESRVTDNAIGAQPRVSSKDSGSLERPGCESCETRPASKWCDGCIVADYQAACGCAKCVVRGSNEARCVFCGKTKSETKILVVPGRGDMVTGICEACIEVAEEIRVKECGPRPSDATQRCESVNPGAWKTGVRCTGLTTHAGDHYSSEAGVSWPRSAEDPPRPPWRSESLHANMAAAGTSGAEAATQKRAGRFECGVCGKRIWRGWFAPGIAGGPPSPVKCGACSNPPRAEEIPAEHADNAREVEEIRELVSGMFEERTNNATAMKDLIDDVVEHIYQERQRRERATGVRVKPREEWHEDMGPVLWWSFPVEEPPYAGTPLDDDFPEYMTYWTPIVQPEPP